MNHKTLHVIAESIAYNAMDVEDAYQSLVAYVDIYAQTKNVDAATDAAHQAIKPKRSITDRQKLALKHIAGGRLTDEEFADLVTFIENLLDNKPD